MRFAFIALLFVGLQARAAVTCPLGGDAHLTIQRVMINFGKYTADADAITRDASGTDTEIASAVSGLKISQACAQEVVDGTSEDLLPAGARKVTGAKRDNYIRDFKKAMADFAQALGDYADALSRKSFNEAAGKKKLVGDLADEAHSRF